MKREQLEQLIGTTIDQDITSEFGAVMVPANTVIEQHHIDKLLKHRIKQLDVLERANNVTKVVEEATNQVEAMFQFAYANNQVPIDAVKANILPAIWEASENPNLFQLMTELEAKDNYTYRHNVGVGVISTLIGKWMGLSTADLTQLTIAATLHDVGKVKVPSEILNKPGRLTDEEFAIMKKHTQYGYELIKNTRGTTLKQAMVALQHHEREDGSGYPLALSGNNISMFSKIVAVADVFHALGSTRVYRDQSPFYEVLGVISGLMMKGQFAREVASVLIHKLMDRMTGSRVVLTDDRQGTILLVNSQEPLRPLIQCGTTYVDLATERHINIERVLSD